MNKQTARLSMAECIRLRDLGGRERPPWRVPEGCELPPVVIRRVLCCFCREYHSVAEVDGCMALPRKVAGVSPNGSSGSNVLRAGLLSDFCELWAFLTATSYPDGQKRLTGRLSLSSEHGQLGLLLNDDDNGQYCFLNGDSLDDMLLAVETGLAGSTLSWRPSKWAKKGK